MLDTIFPVLKRFSPILHQSFYQRVIIVIFAVSIFANSKQYSIFMYGKKRCRELDLIADLTDTDIDTSRFGTEIFNPNNGYNLQQAINVIGSCQHPKLSADTDHVMTRIA